MPIAFIANNAIELPQRFVAGQVLDDLEASILQREFLKRLNAQIRWRLGRNEIHEATLQREAYAMARSFEFALTGPQADDDEDPITDEAMILARELITKQLAQDGVTVMPNIDQHAKTLAQNSPDLRAKALARIETRMKLGASAIERLGK